VNRNISSPCLSKHEILQWKVVRAKRWMGMFCVQLCSVGGLQWRSGCPGKTTQVVLTEQPPVCEAGLGEMVRLPKKQRCFLEGHNKKRRAMWKGGRQTEIKEDDDDMKCCLTAPAVYFQEDNSASLPLGWFSPGTLLCRKPGPKLCSNSSSLSLFDEQHFLWRDIGS